MPLLAVPLFLLVGWFSEGYSGLLWALLCVFLTSGLSLAYLFYLTRTGGVADPRNISQKERVRPLRVVAALHAGAWATLTLLGGTPELRAILLAYAIATVALAAAVSYVKPSMHTAGVAGAAVCLGYIFGGWGILAALLLPVVGWARFALGRHTPSELALGTLVGAGGTWLSFQLTPVG